MTKSNKQINKEANVSDNDSSPAVVAWRVGQLEANQEKRFDSLSQQLEKIVEGFVTEKEMTEAKLEGAEEHKRIWAAILEIKKDRRFWVTTFLSGVAGAGAVGLLIVGIIQLVKK
jgi:O6-methylguanine-DNA--protein-cysteine methyltransferase